MADKPLVIDTSENGKLLSDRNSWRFIDNQEPFIRNIETNAINDEGVDVGTIVSGIPTVFARVNLFRSAIAACSNPQSNAATSNLMVYYKQLASEWKGLIAAIACDSAYFNVRRVDMAYSDGEPIEKTSNIYEPKGAFGAMLMEGKSLWCNQIRGDQKAGIPFINIIKYDGQVVAGTSPYTMVFTSISYRISQAFALDKPWINNETGRFQDPLEGNIGNDYLRKLYAYINHLLKQVEKVREYYAKSEMLKGAPVETYSDLSEFLGEWRKDIVEYANHPSRQFNLENSATPTVNIFDLRNADNEIQHNAPYSIFFNYQNKLWGVDGNIYASEREGAISFDPQTLLLPEESEIARIILPPSTDEKKLPLLVLKAKVIGDDNPAFFALPLSPKGLDVFGKNIHALVGAADAGVSIQSSITATFNPAATEKQLLINLRLVNTDDSRYQNCERAYTIKPSNIINNKDILIWPNFISKNWNRYFMYSELPHAVQDHNYPYRATPFAADMDNELRIINDEEGNPLLLAKEGRPLPAIDKVKVRMPIVADSRVADKAYKYEIYESNKPFKGVQLASASGAMGGFLIIRYGTNPGEGFPVDLNRDGIKNLHPVNIGIDFGSTNTSVAYFDPKTGSQAEGFVFKNLRILLIRNVKNTDVATPSNLFFFSGNEVPSNAVKSMLTLHDSSRIVKESPNEGDIEMLSKEVKGGFPCFIRNLPISDVENNRIHINLPNSGNVTLINDMKWSEDPEEGANRKAFIRTLVLQIYAQLFAGIKGIRMVPTTLKWSYPSSMSKSMCNKYQSIWRTLDDIYPIETTQADITPINVATVSTQSNQKAGGDVFGFGDSGFDSLGDNLNMDAFGDMSGDFGSDFGSETPRQPQFGKDLVGDGWETEEKSATRGAKFEIENPNAEIVYNPESLIKNSTDALSEACAVANYVSTSTQVDTTSASMLTLCFDIGGSTTDITALCTLNSTPDGLTMIKQNSIRFAAQMVARATKKSPNFCNVLLRICERFDLHISGLSAGPDSRFTPETAPYYFEQIVDRLNPEQLKYFYQEISINCQDLMCVNLYVTGLIMFYAGQLTAKLVHQLKHSRETKLAPNELPNAFITFAGKGSRLFEWWSTVDYNAASAYYKKMFIFGMGGLERAKHLLQGYPTINLSNKINENVKYEVSKGLARTKTNLYVPQNNDAVEIIGENGFAKVNADFSKTSLPADHILTPEMMEDLGNYFVSLQDGSQEPTCKQFINFCSLFFQVTSQTFNLKMTKQEFVQAFKKMNIVAYIRNLPEYERAKAKGSSKDEPFDFVSPIIILEGAKFFNDYLA